jgi:excisionase family DNA binding protein
MTTAKVLTLTEVSNYLRVSRVTIYRMIRRKDIPAFRLAGSWRFNVEDLERWIQRESLIYENRRERKL